MSNLKTTHQGSGNTTSGNTPEGAQGENNKGDEFGAKRPATAGTDRDLDRSGESKNQNHSHPQDQRRDG
ncbi:hypothetical protein [Longimicrobium sp.]|uniref:hypothetical protein n=1 Tax=Longimicrobium sp. TaxID=2029185 RepID=UPI002E2FD6DB|nr:hypothetical protein [Longimicrobium sp.]HEX6039976.1 hypothetical protein [Longimicrobium sp.]